MASIERRRQAHMDEQTKKELEKSGQEAMRDINSRIQEILDRAPSDSSAHLLIRADDGGFKAVLKIISSQQKFVGGDKGEDFRVLMDRVFGEVHHQIREWRRTRFTNPNP